MKASGTRFQPPRRILRLRETLFSTDRLLALSGFALAGLAAFFPWYVFVNQGSFGIKSHGLRLEGRGNGTPSVHRMAGLERLQGVGDVLSTEFDPINTATIPELAKRPKPEDSDEAQDQPFPGRPFQLLHVANGQALISDSSGIYLVRVGSKLPDRSTLSRIDQRGGQWVIETSNGDVIRP